MVEIDLHGLKHEEVKAGLENKILLHYNMGNFPIKVITGNSLMMKKIVSRAIENLKFKESSINTHNGSIVVVE